MNGKVTKKIRKLAYGDFSPRARRHTRIGHRYGGMPIIADDKRRLYKMAKRLYKQGTLDLKGVKCAKKST